MARSRETESRGTLVGCPEKVNQGAREMERQTDRKTDSDPGHCCWERSSERDQMRAGGGDPSCPVYSPSALSSGKFREATHSRSGWYSMGLEAKIARR